MSSNLLKMGVMSFQEGEKRVIDVNTLMEKRIEELTVKMKQPENTGFVNIEPGENFSAGLDAEQLEGIFSGEEETNRNVIKAEVEVASARAREEAEQILMQARKEAEAEKQAYISAAQAQIARERSEAVETARVQGYEEGKQKAREELARMEQEFTEKVKAVEEEYDRLLEQTETKLVDVLADVYEQLFLVELSSYKELVIHLVASALHKIEGGRDFLVHISPEDYPYVSMEKKQLLSALASPNATLELVEDITLKKNECMIETDNGIFDCGLGTQLSEVGRRLRLLSYERS